MERIMIDERRVLLVPGNMEETVGYAAQHWKDCCDKAIHQHGAFFVALSGGSTPKAIFAQLTQDPYKSQIPWEKIHFFWSDERPVVPTDSDSNYRMAMEYGLKDMPIPPSHIHRMEAEHDVVRGAEQYEGIIRATLKNRSFDLIMLGMGEDGHTASLFPRTAGLSVEDRWVIANHIPQKDTWRMTMTYPCINAASHIVLYVIGASKHSMLTQILQGSYDPIQFPSQKIGTPINKALWMADVAAAHTFLYHKGEGSATC